MSEKRLAKRPSDREKAVILSTKLLETPKEIRQVLTEEKYLEKLDRIIQSDYYPDVPKLKAQLEYLTAVDKNDVAKIRELQQRYSTKRRTDRRTSPMRRSPELFDPDSTAGPSLNTEGDNDEKQATKEEQHGEQDNEVELSLDRFLAKYTSEDNASFVELTDLSDIRERIQHSWMYEAEKEHNRNRVLIGIQVIHGDAQLKGADEQFALPNLDPPRALDNWAYTTRNHVLFHPEDAPLTMQEVADRQKLNQRRIQKQATRFMQNPFREQSKRNTLNKAAVLHAAAEKGKVDVSGLVFGDTEGHSQFPVLATPSPAPGVSESPMMTWGEIEGTPFRLDASDMPIMEGGPVFKIPEVPMRDQLAQGISDTIAKRYRDKRKRAVEQAESLYTKTPRFGSRRSSDRIIALSPAARRLATNKLGIRLGSDKALKASYTPSPAGHFQVKTPKSSTTPKSAMKTPKIESSSNKAIPTSSITDNLLDLDHLNLNSRPSAADFF